MGLGSGGIMSNLALVSSLRKFGGCLVVNNGRLLWNAFFIGGERIWSRHLFSKLKLGDYRCEQMRYNLLGSREQFVECLIYNIWWMIAFDEMALQLLQILLMDFRQT